MAESLTGIVESVHVGDAKAGRTKRSVSGVRIDEQGIVGDRHWGFTRKSCYKDAKHLQPPGTEMRNERQWGAMSQAEIDAIRKALNLEELDPAILCPNFVFRGINGFSQIEPGSRLLFANKVALVVEEFMTPCTDMGELIAERYPRDKDGEKVKANAFPKAAAETRGLVGTVERAESDALWIRPKDVVTVKLFQRKVFKTAAIEG